MSIDIQRWQKVCVWGFVVRVRELLNDEDKVLAESNLPSRHKIGHTYTHTHKHLHTAESLHLIITWIVTVGPMLWNNKSLIVAARLLKPTVITPTHCDHTAALWWM